MVLAAVPVPRGGGGGQGICLAPVFDLGLAEDPGGRVMQSFLEPSKLLSLGMGTPEPGNTPSTVTWACTGRIWPFPAHGITKREAPRGGHPLLAWEQGQDQSRRHLRASPGPLAGQAHAVGSSAPAPQGRSVLPCPQYFRLAW